MLDSALEIVTPAAEAKGVSIERTGTQPIRLWGDAERLQQVAWNLLSNAVKFTPGGGSVRVNLTQTEKGIVLTVQDTGAGIAPEFLPHVFERFRQGAHGAERGHGGLGLGLAVVKHVVEAHGGEVRAFSKGPGTGATFVVRLPIGVSGETDDERNAPGWTEIDGVLRLRGIRVLVVDNLEDTLTAMVRTLTEAGAVAVGVRSAPEAMAQISTQLPDVLLSDIGLPGQDGLGLIREVRRLPGEAGGTIPAAAVTAYAEAEDRARAIREGYQLYLTKPVEPMELVHTVAVLANRSLFPV